MNKVKAFSLVELMVVMLISGITISMAYTCFGLINHQLIMYRKDSEVNADQVDFQYVLRSDIHHCTLMKRSSFGFVLEFQADEVVTYELYDFGLLRRKNQVVDTFKLNEPKAKYYYNDNAVLGSQDYFDQAHIVIGQPKDEIIYSIGKHYSAQDMDRIIDKNKVWQ